MHEYHEPKTEARIRTKTSTENHILIDIASALDVYWSPNGCSFPIEAYCIRCLKNGEDGKIVEARYTGGPQEFYPKTEFDDATSITIPQTIINSALQETYDGVKEEYRTPSNKLKAWHFKILNQNDWEFIKNNCYRQNI